MVVLDGGSDDGGGLGSGKRARKRERELAEGEREGRRKKTMELEIGGEPMECVDSGVMLGKCVRGLNDWGHGK